MTTDYVTVNAKKKGGGTQLDGKRTRPQNTVNEMLGRKGVRPISFFFFIDRSEEGAKKCVAQGRKR